MKLNLSIIIILLVSTACCAQHYGIYNTKINYTGYGYNLMNDGKFTYDEASCTEFKHGKGNYVLIGDTLRFNFIEQKLEKRGHYSLEKTGELETEIELDIMVIDSITQKAIFSYTAALYEDEQLITGTDGKFDGKAYLKTAYKQKPIKIVLNCLGCYPLEIDIIKPGQYSVYVEMFEGIFNPIPPQVRDLRIITWDQDSLVYGDFYDDNWSATIYKYEAKRKIEK